MDSRKNGRENRDGEVRNWTWLVDRAFDKLEARGRKAEKKNGRA